MLNFTYICSALVAALLISLTLSTGARPEALKTTITQDAPQLRLTAAEGAEFGSEVPYEPEEALFDSKTSEAADSLSSVSTYYSLRPDLRRCASPLCGGYFVRRVNQSRTRCADGKLKTECYVAEIDWNGHPKVDPRRALLRADVVAKGYRSFGKLGALHVRESWQAASDPGVSASDVVRSDGFFRVKDRGVRCITHPCPTHHEAKLNTLFHRNIAGVDFTGAGAPDALVAQASAAMTEGDGVPVVGSHVQVSGPGGKSLTLRATQFYLRAKGETANKPCIRTGCGNQVCAEEPVISTCEWRPEYECYKTAKCERQANGSCGYTQTARLKSCLARNK
ncbi:MAG: DUF6748 domain-containing protein [Pyrinomonadaceae bacterium]